MELFSFVLVPLALALVIPRLWLVPCTFLVLLAFTGLWVDEQRMQCASCGGPFSGLGLALLVIAVAGFIIGVAVRALIAFFRPARKSAPGQARAAKLLTWALVSATMAVLVTGLAVVLLNKMFDSGWLTHLGICLLAVAWFCWTPFFWPKGSEAEPVWRSLLHPAGVFRWIGAVAVFFLVAWSVRVIAATQEAAELAAVDHPYCLTISTEKGQRPVQTFWDLSGFSMQADRGSSRHAALVTGGVRAPVWFYWSYRRGAFEPDFMGWPLTCELQSGFAKNLPAVQPVSAADPGRSFWLGRGQWYIPADYRGGARDQPPVLSFHAQGKDFEPLPASPQSPAIVDLIQAEVSVTLCDLENLHVWQTRNDVNYKVEPAGTEAGLEKQSVESRGSLRREFQYVGRDETGRISTWMMCPQSGNTCRHAFRREGVVVAFQRPSSQFAEWREIEDAAWKRVKTFAVEWPDAEPQSCKS
ncbi:hypothetical protein [Polaromonas sp. YR568]|uniref:hypothetical protein n=1 Tax=Polaromonas sp. YR568 TaxID=1855301 RepID=UPI00398BEDD0